MVGTALLAEQRKTSSGLMIDLNVKEKFLLGRAAAIMYEIQCMMTISREKNENINSSGLKS